MTSAAIDWGQLLELVWAAALAGVAVAASFALIILGAAQASECRRTDRTVRATAYGVLSVVAAVVFVGAVVFAIVVITAK
jgi:uncharacterized membrane protein